MTAAAFLCSAACISPAFADELIEEYSAYISRNDLYNSSGERLTKAWQIIRQDRANYHRFGQRDDEDEFDSFFADARNRENAEAMIREDGMPRRIEKLILRGDMMIDVKIWGYGDTGYFLEISTR